MLEKETLQAKFTMKKTTLDQKLDLLKSRVAKTCLDDEYPEEKKQADEPEIKEVGLN